MDFSFPFPSSSRRIRAVWFKVHHDGKTKDGKWAAREMFEQLNGTYTFRIPPKLLPGQYLIRHEWYAKEGCISVIVLKLTDIVDIRIALHFGECLVPLVLKGEILKCCTPFSGQVSRAPVLSRMYSGGSDREWYSIPDLLCLVSWRVYTRDARCVL